jgi:hypothetical protein
MTGGARRIASMGRMRLGIHSKMLILAALKRLFLATRFRRTERRLEALSRRMGLLQLGGSVQLFERVAGLSDMATGGLGARQSLTAMSQVLESPANVSWERIGEAMDAIETYLKDANVVLDAYDHGRPRKERLFVARKGMKGLF